MALNCGRASSRTACHGTTSLLSVELSQSPACIATGYLIQIRIVPAKSLDFFWNSLKKQCFHCARTISVILRPTIVGLALIAGPKIVLCNGQPFKASILLLTEIYEYKFERFPFLSTSEAWAAGVRTDRNKGICYDNNNHSYHNNRVFTENDKNRTYEHTV